MYCIIVYDVQNKKVNKLCGFLKGYLNWIQNSVFEGEVSEVNLNKIKIYIENLIDKNRDSIILFTIDSKFAFSVKKEVIGKEKGKTDVVI